MSTACGNATDLLQLLIEQAVEVAMRKVLEGNTAGNRRLLSPEETATYLSLSKRENYNMIANGQIAVVTHGRRRMLDIPTSTSGSTTTRGKLFESARKFQPEPSSTKPTPIGRGIFSIRMSGM